MRPGNGLCLYVLNAWLCQDMPYSAVLNRILGLA